MRISVTEECICDHPYPKFVVDDIHDELRDRLGAVSGAVIESHRDVCKRLYVFEAFYDSRSWTGLS